MRGYAEVEIGLHRSDSDRYAVELRFSRPDSDAILAPVQGFTTFDFAALRARTADADEYGMELTASLFGATEVRKSFEQFRTIVAASDFSLRIRLFVGPSAPELHSLRWETLRDPQQISSSLLSNENMLFSRYLASLDWRPVRPRRQGALRALVVIANPSELIEGKYRPNGRQLAPVDVAGELERAQDGLAGVPVTALASNGTANLNNIVSHLRDRYDILYLVCHGAQIEGEARLWLEDEQGNASVVAASELVVRLSDLQVQERPQLVVLASCQSAGSGREARSSDGGTLVAVGPRLAEVGIPAVVAMQGDITMSAAADFMPVFFRELQRDGQIDRAMAAARATIRDRTDYWAPVLFLRLSTGLIWYVPGFSDEQADFLKWPSLLDNIYDGRCTPIMGSGLLEELVGSTRELAQRWAEVYRFPMAPYEREDLPQVAQYLAVNQQWDKPNREFANHVLQELSKRYGAYLQPEFRNARLDQLQQLLAAVGLHLRETSRAEPHMVLAGLPFPIYITTNPDNLLAEALIAAGKSPQVELCRWNDDVRWPRSVFDADPDYVPTVERPLVYHLFGHVKLLESVVLKEDDFFDYLIGVTSNKESIPDIVRRALADTSLLFLGFHMDDWDFRALFRSLMIGQEGRKRRNRYVHVAAQLDPEEGRNLDPEGARRYLQSYFQEADISIYWGSVEDLMGELQLRWPAYFRDQRIST
jgi:hypothetical protein